MREVRPNFEKGEFFQRGKTGQRIVDDGAPRGTEVGARARGIQVAAIQNSQTIGSDEFEQQLYLAFG